MMNKFDVQLNSKVHSDYSNSIEPQHRIVSQHPDAVIDKPTRVLSYAALLFLLRLAQSFFSFASPHQLEANVRLHNP